jgi:hypothetical protein
MAISHGIVDTGGKFATGMRIIATSGLVAKFATGVLDTGNKFDTNVVDTASAS